MREKSFQYLKAVGLSGKRSIMLACVLAMSMNDPDGLEDLWEGLRTYKLHRQYWELLESVKGANGISGGSSDSYSKWTKDTDNKWGGKRKWESDDGWSAKSEKP